ncbi:hypothetical protein (macronuclear) [Paramecium tetraurelia strain d4-2]|uniref:Uncharacterized protein n=1 Tax=Paramecium tetraurelia TaxID=5888 RepID=Q6BGC2_PARTE|nr:hypothetical protein [Paramecium tetraurelia strain d4-2]CAH03298.1 hypothetical protein PTMB.101c [Paramecium tetraurelia]
MDYTFIQNSENFNFYGLFSYFKLSFQQDLQLSQMIQKTKEEDTLEKRICDPEFSYNPKLFSITNYPKSFNLNNIIKYSQKDTKQKIMSCKLYGLQFKDQYFYVLGLRSLLYQPITFEQSLQQMCMFSNLIQLEDYILGQLLMFSSKRNYQCYFLTLLITFIVRYMMENNPRLFISFNQKYNICDSQKVTYGFQLDEIIVTNNNKCIIYRARYQEQRNYIAEVFRFAIAKDLEIKVMSHFINPNDSDFRTKMIEQENVRIVFNIQSLKVVQQSTFKLIRNDRVVPPSPLLTYKGRIICDYLSTPLHGNFTYYISLGQNNIVQHKYPQNFVTIIPYMSDQFYLEETQCQTCLGLHVGKQLNYAYFGSSQERENFQNAIRARKSGVINLDVIFIHFEEDSLDRLVQFKRIKLKEINQRIEQTEQQLQQLQSIKNELEMDVIEGELNSAVKLKYSSLMMQSQSILHEVSGFDSPSFLQQK